MKDEDLDTSGIVTLAARNAVQRRHGVTDFINRTAQYVAVNDAKKDLLLAMADMSIFSSAPRFKSPLPRSEPKRDQWIVVDANWSPRRIREMMRKPFPASIAFEPVSVAKSAQLFQPDIEKSAAGEKYKVAVDIFPTNIVDLTTPNQHELAAMHASAKEHEFFESDRWWQVIDALGIPSSGARDLFVKLTSHKMTDEGIPLQTIQLLPFIPTIITKLGPEGVLFTKLLKPDDYRLTDPAAAPYILSRSSNGSMEVGGVYMRLFPAVEKVDEVVSVNGVGDTFLGVLIAGMAKGINIERMINVAQTGAVMTLKSTEAVHPELGRLGNVLSRMADEAADTGMDEDLLAAAGF
jgi:pseudouridine-5'-phosphate glycosidase/pseudouridine kinase